MIGSVLRSIEGVEIYPIISLLLFFATFIVMLIRVVGLDKKFLRHMSELPLDSSSSDPMRKGDRHHG